MGDNRKDWDTWAEEDPLWHIAHVKTEDEFATSGADIVAKFFAPWIASLPKHSRLLDIGCGLGRLTNAASKVRDDILCFGVDVSPVMIQQATERHARDNRLIFLTGNGRDFGMLPSQSFDMVMSYVVFQHIPTPVFAGYVAEVARILRPGGLFVFQMQYDPDRLDRKYKLPDDDFRTVRYYDDTDLAALLPVTFQIAEQTKCGTKKLHNVMTAARLTGPPQSS
jgi:SAM-dependent methyltransferase